MTEKRYTYLNASKCKSIGSFFCNGIILTNGEVVDLLNENEQLKLEIQQIKKDTDRIAIKLHKDCDEVYYENQKLKQEIQQLKNQELYQENKGLDRMNEISIDISKLRPFDCKYYRYQTLLSKTACMGYCQMGDDDLSLRYCKGVDCEEYEKKENLE